MPTNPTSPATTGHRAQVVAEAVVSAYIDEIARSARPRRRLAAAHRRAPARRRRPVALELELRA